MRRLGTLTLLTTCLVLAMAFGVASAHAATVSLRAVIDTEGAANAYSEIYLFGDCANVPASPARVTFSGYGEHRTLTIANPCVGEWHRSGGAGPLPGLALTPHRGTGHLAASVEFGTWGEPGRRTYLLTVAYARQRLTALVTVIVTPGRGRDDGGSAIRIRPLSR